MTPPIWAVTWQINQQVEPPERVMAEPKPSQRATITGPEGVVASKEWLLPWKQPPINVVLFAYLAGGGAGDLNHIHEIISPTGWEKFRSISHGDGGIGSSSPPHRRLHQISIAGFCHNPPFQQFKGQNEFHTIADLHAPGSILFSGSNALTEAPGDEASIADQPIGASPPYLIPANQRFIWIASRMETGSPNIPFTSDKSSNYNPEDGDVLPPFTRLAPFHWGEGDMGFTLFMHDEVTIGPMGFGNTGIAIDWDGQVQHHITGAYDIIFRIVTASADMELSNPFDPESELELRANYTTEPVRMAIDRVVTAQGGASNSAIIASEELFFGNDDLVPSSVVAWAAIGLSMREVD